MAGPPREGSGPSDLQPALLGRTSELHLLHDVLRDGVNNGHALVITGDAGIGKSSLLSAAVDLARSEGYAVLTLVGVEGEWHLPYAGLHRLLRPLHSHDAGLPVPQRRALAAAFGMGAAEPPEPFLVSLASLTLLTLASTAAPLLLCLDDAHWLDEPTQEALAFVARRVVAEHMVVLGAVRNGHTSVVGAACAQQLEVHGLDDAAALTLLTRHAPDLGTAERDRVLAHALGNPLALVELPSAGGITATMASDLTGEPVPLSERLEHAFADRLADLLAPTRDALLLAATDGQCDLTEILEATTVLSGQPVDLETVESAARAGLVSVGRQGLTFRHPLIRSAVLQAESLARQRAAHRALGDALHADRYRRTWHRGEAAIGSDDALAGELEHMHTIALRRGSAQAAIIMLERSAALTTDAAHRARRLLLAAEHAYGLGRADQVDRLLSAAERNGLSQLGQARMEWLREIFDDGVPGDAARVRELCGSARLAGLAGDNDLALNLLLGAALRCWWAETGPEARSLVVETLRGLVGALSDARFVAVLGIAAPVLECAAVEEILTGVVEETIVDAGDLRFYGWAAHAVGDPARAVDFFERAETRFRDEGRLGLLSHVLTMSSVDRLQLGEWQQLRRALSEAQQIAHDTGQPIWDLGSLSVTAIELGLRGDPAAYEAAARAELLASRRSLTVMLTCVQVARGFAAASARRYAEAYSELRRIFDPADPVRHEREAFTGIMVFAEAAAHTGQLADARSVVADLEVLARVCPSPLLHDQLGYARAVLADDADAEQLFLAALSADLTRWPWTKARLQLAFGSWLRRQRRVAESRPFLRNARAAFELIGAASWAQQAHIELRAAGDRSASLEPADAEDLLSPQELQIAHLAADGLSNKQIAERLYLSPRTVSSHLYRMFPKLGITSRSQIARRLRRD